MFRTSARCSRRICGRCCPLRIRRSKKRGLIPALPGLAPVNRKTVVALRVVFSTPPNAAAAFRTPECCARVARYIGHVEAYYRGLWLRHISVQGGSSSLHGGRLSALSGSRCLHFESFRF